MARHTVNPDNADPAHVMTRRAECMRLRLANNSYEAIGRAVGISTPAAWKHVQIAIAELRKECSDAAENIRAMELERLDRLQSRLWPRCNAGDDKAVRSMLACMERRAKLLGLDAPTKIAPTDPTGEHEYVFRDPNHDGI